MERREQLAASLAAVHGRIEAACQEVGRSPEELTLVVITKFFPASDVALLAGLGVTDVGENKDQEASAKVAELAAEVRAALRVHFVGQLQTNKARSVARYADVVQSVDRPKLVRALGKAVGTALEVGERQADLDVLLQVDLEEGEHAGRGGALPGALDALAEAVTGTEHLVLRGLMAVAPPGLDEAGTAAAFERLQGYAARLAGQVPSATWLSAGMSGDLEHAIRHGATHLRVGTAILGSRPDPR